MRAAARGSPRGVRSLERRVIRRTCTGIECLANVVVWLSFSLRARGTLTALGRNGRSHERGSARDGKFGEGKMTWNTVRSARPPALIGRRLRLMALLLGAGAMAACASAGSVGQRAAAAAMTPTSIVIE